MSIFRILWKNVLQPLIKGHNMATVNINGVTYTGDNISIVNNKVGGRIIIDGVVQQSDVQGVVEVRVLEGTIGNLTSHASVTCGDVMGYVDAGSSVQCKNVGQYVDAGSSVTCGNVGGNVDAGSSVKCGDVAGNVDAGSSVTCNSAKSISK